MCEICGGGPCIPGCPNYQPKGILCVECDEIIPIGEYYFDSNNGPVCYECLSEKTVAELFDFFGERLSTVQED